ncbi:hypothetical protein DICPUDRAFT_57493 [Dictyostelium purpureum]|uniref:ABC transporter domain-containing protein n=1 Tax=Dictyostelium purpureum TaxID=5786 RepID=F0ZWA1_DICPU|nr:uncharacterized protein DICPUDRAFT_57493 [Dictyostelium purpureum]EGC31772.1 hypothetical protein DICPUDRAFT_57493 [Dictyostelium purpureum]|eukprot:XP_003291695.1 hypothetical protein DICPUDRAFT_57493 [Dictyostelium purpureum]
MDSLKNEDSSIRVENLTRGYGDFKVLDNINFSIEEGSVCALIGASGSGKTTIIKTLLGRLYPDGGRVLIFGKEPYSSPDFDYPGSLVGYAPQECALYLELTIGETLDFFGNIHCMDKELYKKKRDSIITLLGLPDKNRIVNTLSGGQKRRVSLAVAFLHDPKILYLDEPTVGIDPLISKRIWEHLNHLSKNQNVTILITTHYIEEARQADSILLLRDGAIIEKGSPGELLTKYKCTFLEEVYFKVCGAISPIDQIEVQTLDGGVIEKNKVVVGDNNNSLLMNSGLQEITMSRNNNTATESKNQKKVTRLDIIKKKFSHSYAVFKRALLSVRRVKLLLVLLIVSPTLLCILFFITIGSVPHSVPFGFINHDSGTFGKMLIEELSRGPTFNMHNLTQIDTAIGDIRNSKLCGFIEIPKNFSDGVINRYFNPSDVSLPNSEVIPYLDESNQQITVLIMQSLQNAFIKLSNDSGVKIYPITETVQVFDGNSDFTWFLGPAIIPAIIFVHAMVYMEIQLIKERNNGCMDRLFSYGVSAGSNIVGYIMCNCVILFIQNSVILLLGHFAFNVPVRGNIVLVYLILYMIETIGVEYGILFSIFCEEEVDGVQISLGVFFTLFFVSGTIWPLEAIPSWFTWATYIMPTTWAWKALRAVMIKDLPFSHIDIWRPFVIIFAALILWFFVIIHLVKLRQKNSRFKFNIKNLMNKIKK